MKCWDKTLKKALTFELLETQSPCKEILRGCET